MFTVANAMLKYPVDLDENVTDFVTFSHFPYSTNRKTSGGFTPPPAGGSGRSSIVLYVPNSIPSMGYRQAWEAETLPGSKGNLIRDVSSSFASLSTSNPVDAAKNVVDALTKGLGQGGNAARQVYIEAIAEASGRQANAILSQGTGKIFNPNVEVFYQGPALRDYSFAFTFAPKSEQESLVVKKIIDEFKIWSAPTVEDSQGAMLKIPDLWMVNYGGKFKANKFKKSTLNNIDVGYNPGLNSHMTFSNGEPVITTIRLDFTEVDYVLREDHKKAGLGGF